VLARLLAANKCHSARNSCLLGLASLQFPALELSSFSAFQLSSLPQVLGRLRAT